MIILAGHWNMAILQKKKYLWKSSLLLDSFGCGGLENDEY